jgi:hypothetical protein
MVIKPPIAGTTAALASGAASVSSKTGEDSIAAATGVEDGSIDGVDSGDSSEGSTPPSDHGDAFRIADEGLERLTQGREQLAGAERLLAEGVEGMKSHIASLEKELAKERTEGEELRRAYATLEQDVQRYALPFQPSRFPWFADEGIEGVPEFASYAVANMFRGLTSAFSDDNAQLTSKKMVALMEAYRTLSLKNDIVGASYAINCALATILSPNIHSFEKRGSFHEVVRLANLIESGRDIDHISVQIPNIGFEGWWIDYKYNTITKRYFETAAEIDAKEGGTLIEVKSVWLGNSLGHYLSRMLKADHSGSIVHISKRIDHSSQSFKTIKMAVGIANQLARYKKMMESGLGDHFEFHVTSPEPVPEDTLEAFRIFFGEGKIDVIWYSDILQREGINITRETAERDTIPETESPAPAHEDAVEGPAEVIAPDAAPEAASKTAATETVEDIPDAEAWDDTEAEADEEMSEEEIAAQAEFHERFTDASLAIYQSRRFLEHVGHDASKLEGFMESIVSEGHWQTSMSALSGDDLFGRLRPLYDTWLARQEEAARSQAAANAPWQAVDDKAARSTFNAFLANQDPRRKADMAIDWRKRVAQTIFNEHVTGALAEMQDTDAVKAEGRLSNRIGVFIEHLRNRYSPRSYFKIREDGPELMAIMKQYVWLTDGGASANGS